MDTGPAWASRRTSLRYRASSPASVLRCFTGLAMPQWFGRLTGEGMDSAEHLIRRTGLSGTAQNAENGFPASHASHRECPRCGTHTETERVYCGFATRRRPWSAVAHRAAFFARLSRDTRYSVIGSSLLKS